jgi:hypothetical protein
MQAHFDGALLLGTPSLEHAETWVNALRRAIHNTSTNRVKRSRTVVEDADEEEENGDDQMAAREKRAQVFFKKKKGIKYFY